VDYGFGQSTHIDYPGESIGDLDNANVWTPIQAANIAFGQGMRATTLQVCSFYSAIANGGVKVQPHFLLSRPQYDNAPSYPSDNILEPETTQKLESMLRSVVTDGTGKNADISGYTVVGKTGTAQKAKTNGSGYIDGQYIVSFVGYLADSSSELTCMVSLDNPTGALGNTPSTPLFKQMMTDAIARYGITSK
jgi:cell division protein FtsI (penicillin-binding protein 3)